MSASIDLVTSPEVSRVGVPDEDTVDGICAALENRGHVTVRVWGRSMLPFVWPGATVTVHAVVDRTSLREGDLVLVRHGSVLALHRLVDPATGTTQGDSFTDPDPPGTIAGRARSQLLGRWHVRSSLDRIVATAAVVASPHARRVRDRARPMLRSAWASFVRSRTAAKARRTLWPHEVELLAPRHLCLVKRYLLKRGQRPVRATLTAWRSAAERDGDRFIAVVATRRGIAGSLTAVRDRGGGTWVLVDLWVDRHLRGLGTAAALVRTVAAEASRRGPLLLRAHVRHERGAAWHAFAAAGFTETGPAPDVSPFHVRMERTARS